MLAWPAWWSNTVPDEPFDDIDLTALAAEECARAGLEFAATAVMVIAGSARLPPTDRSAGRAALHADARP